MLADGPVSYSARHSPISEDIKPHISPLSPGSDPTRGNSRSSKKGTSSTRKGTKSVHGLTSATPDQKVKGTKKSGGWSKAEVRALFDAMDLIPAKVRWDDIASKVPGRDKLSCSNKWRYDVLPKLQGFIDSLGE